MCSGCLERDGLTREQRILRQAEFAAHIEAAEQAPPEGESDDHIVVVHGFTPRPIVRTVPAEWLTSPPPVMGGSDNEEVDGELIEAAEESDPREGAAAKSCDAAEDAYALLVMPARVFRQQVEEDGPQVHFTDDGGYVMLHGNKIERFAPTLSGSDFAGFRKVNHDVTPKG